MLRSHNQQYVELDFFTSFLNHAINGNQAYFRIVEPIILDAASLARHEKNIADIDRTGLNIKLFLFDWGSTNLQPINADNLNDNLPLILNIINDHRNTVMA
ncbi:hypothetical protein FHW88_002513 [Mucilaginibacter sp. SG538B]|uniref:hypothetical protein n=1 Tax=Mucilaginibacter sp. SG538B TaxID=2587021 RepID=UPI00159D7C52|nr:hypothetical protein [Mucilaginibacter sp. SG538B]NVM64185.1 hypothetical protein [Mucilaginibacter sp. SG538B]NVM64224.1 hypothetical protein [Mucilaginibacter sp. SG538B]